jgi:rRNA maturation endonuclease Nob1
MGSCLDLRQYQDPEAIQDAFAKVVSGRAGYKAIIERRVEPVKCRKCGRLIEDASAKFCPDCGEKVERKPVSSKCKKCNTFFNENDVFCMECGAKRE